MSKLEEKLLVYSNGEKKFYIEPDTAYQIIAKYDADAPDGFQKVRTTKLPDPSVAVNGTPLAFYDMDRQVFDTALTENSKALIKLYPDAEERRRALTKITKHITNPLLSLKGNIEPNNFALWDDFSFPLSVDTVLKSSDPLQLFYLYSLIIHGKLAPVGFESEAYFKKQCTICC